VRLFSRATVAKTADFWRETKGWLQSGGVEAYRLLEAINSAG